MSKFEETNCTTGVPTPDGGRTHSRTWGRHVATLPMSDKSVWWRGASAVSVYVARNWLIIQATPMCGKSCTHLLIDVETPMARQLSQRIESALSTVLALLTRTQRAVELVLIQSSNDCEVFCVLVVNVWCEQWLCADNVVFSGVTRMGVTRGDNWRYHPYFFLQKTDDLFSHHRLPVLRCHFHLVSAKSWRPFLLITITFYHFYWFHSGVTPWRVSPRTFSPDFVCPLFFVNLPTIFFHLGVTPCRVSPGAVRPLPLLTPLWYF